eukprot:scaffold1199_cov265-Pinguiococcus_pyrenoidosus.AAC.34
MRVKKPNPDFRRPRLLSFCWLTAGLGSMTSVASSPPPSILDRGVVEAALAIRASSTRWRRHVQAALDNVSQAFCHKSQAHGAPGRLGALRMQLSQDVQVQPQNEDEDGALLQLFVTVASSRHERGTATIDRLWRGSMRGQSPIWTCRRPDNKRGFGRTRKATEVGRLAAQPTLGSQRRLLGELVARAVRHRCAFLEEMRPDFSIRIDGRWVELHGVTALAAKIRGDHAHRMGISVAFIATARRGAAQLLLLMLQLLQVGNLLSCLDDRLREGNRVRDA